MASPYAEILETRWMTFAQRLGADMKAAGAVFDAIVDAYSLPIRAYHTLTHIKACLDLVDSHVPVGAGLNEIELALWWHDYVYIPGRSNNEEESAFAMHRAGRRMGLDEKLIADVADIIMYTRHSEATASKLEALADRYKYVVDVDLSILGAEPPVFAEYEKGIRIEYGFVPWEQYCAGRGKILNEFLSRPSIFVTERFRFDFEAQARENIRQSLGALA